jgi:hypothetical protein
MSFAADLEQAGHAVEVRILPSAGHHDIYQPNVIAPLLEKWLATAA